MRKPAIMIVTLFSVLFAVAPLFAATTVTVDDNKVTVDQNQPGTTTVIQQEVPQAVVTQKESAIIAAVEDPRKLEGQIIRVDIPENQIVVQDVNGRERKVLLKQGMINSYKVDDYVQIYLMADFKEAKTIRTVRTADLEGDVVAADYSRNQMVVRDAGSVDHVVILSPGMSGKYQVRDHVRLYVVSDSPNVKEVKLIRVK